MSGSVLVHRMERQLRKFVRNKGVLHFLNVVNAIRMIKFQLGPVLWDLIVGVNVVNLDGSSHYEN